MHRSCKRKVTEKTIDFSCRIL